MFIISLTYKVSLEMIDDELGNHVLFLKEQYALGNFVASGRKVPRTGGIILSQLKDQDELESIIHKDPFYKKALVDYSITEFIPSMTNDEFKHLIEE